MVIGSADPDQMLQNAASDQGSTVFKQFSHFSLGICKSHSWAYLKLKMDSSSL